LTNTTNGDVAPQTGNYIPIQKALYSILILQ